MNYYITTDATGDMPKSFYKDCFRIMQMNYLLDDVLYECSPESLDYDVFYDKVKNGSMPTTSLITVDIGKEYFEEILKKGYDILHIAFSSKLSGTYENMVLAAEQLKPLYPDRKIIVKDSKSASGGEGLLVYKILQKREEGASIEEAAEYFDSIRNHINHFFTVEDLFHLFRGDRLSKTAATVGTMLNLKPVLYVDDEGRLIPIAKTMGRKPAVRMLADKFFEKSQGYVNDTVLISHGSCLAEAEDLAAKLKAKQPDLNVVIDYIGPVIGSHCGKGVLALFFMGKDREK